MKFIANLQTSRNIPRPVSFFGSTETSVISYAVIWLEAQGEHGDSFSIEEIVRRPVRTIECGKEPAPLPEPTGGRHAFMKGKSPLRCDRCNGLFEEHT